MSSVSDLSRKYSAQVSQLQAIFPEWDEGDLAFALQDVKGSLEEAVLAITEGMSTHSCALCGQHVFCGHGVVSAGVSTGDQMSALWSAVLVGPCVWVDLEVTERRSAPRPGLRANS